MGWWGGRGLRLATYVTDLTLPVQLDVMFHDAVNTMLGTDIANLAPDLLWSDLVAAFLTRFLGLNQQETVAPSEIMRLNNAAAPTQHDAQSNLGAMAGGLARFLNGPGPGDDTADIGLRLVMVPPCHDLPIGEALGADENDVTLDIPSPADALVGNVPFTDWAPIRATELKNEFLYLNDPLAGSPGDRVRSEGNRALARPSAARGGGAGLTAPNQPAAGALPPPFFPGGSRRLPGRRPAPGGAGEGSRPPAPCLPRAP